MQRFRYFEAEYGVDIRPGWIKSDAVLTVNRKRTLITYRRDLLDSAPARALLAVATLIEVLGLDWEGRQFRVRFPLPDDSPETTEATACARRDYRRPERLAIRRLLPDDLLEEAERKDWPMWEIAEMSGLDEETCLRRVREWQESRRRIVHIAAYRNVELGDAIPF